MIRCPSCAAEAPDGSLYCPRCAAPLETTDTSAPTQTSDKGKGVRNLFSGEKVPDTYSGGAASGEESFSAPSFRARFLPGTVLAKRYRIVGLLGRGGMGEVYRADDLKLGQPVALKFLPQKVQQDAGRLNRFLNEVRVALKVTHPNVCRVYDIGEMEASAARQGRPGQDQHYLSMEYVDGEDLASLLRRIGRLPQDKAVQIARQLCAGLAAAHEQGVLHRDFKPANVMIDGRGRAKITDFGLAGLAEGIQGDEVRAGTPMYMAPEQLAGREVTVQSDIYALGLVLYELFTGKRAFDARTPAEIARLRNLSSPASPSSLIDGLDPAIERVILRCLEKEPGDRPPSALAVAAQLPGGDPLAAALAAGETPSPELVAAAGPRGGLRPGAAAACLAIVVVGVVSLAVIYGFASTLSIFPFTNSFEVLRADAREIAEKLGYDEPPEDRAASFEFNFAEYAHFVRTLDAISCREKLEDPEQVILRFFYRQSPSALVPSNLAGGVSSDDPPAEPGDVTMRLDLEGRLLEFKATPPRREDPAETAPAADWSSLFDAAGLDPTAFEETAPVLVPEVFADTRMAWTGQLPNEEEDVPVRLEAAAWRGKPVYFEKMFESHPQWPPDADATAEDAEQDAGPPASLKVALVVVLLLLAAVLVGVVLLAMRNLSLGRGDRRGALRIATLIFALRLAEWAVTGHHVMDVEEIDLSVVALSGALALALLAWLLYVALEPYVRRLWPETIVSWSRLLSGRFRDPLVGRDVLIGMAICVIVGHLFTVMIWVATARGMVPPILSGPLSTLRGGRYVPGELFTVVLTALPFSLGLMILLLLFRIVLRKTWLAGIALCLVWGGFNGVLLGNMYGAQFDPGRALFGASLGMAAAAFYAIMLVRFGLVATVSAMILGSLLDNYPITGDVSAPYFATSLIGPFAAVALAIYAFRISLAGQPIFREDSPGAGITGRR